MDTNFLADFSNHLADAIDRAAPSVVQVQARRRPATGLVYAPDVVLTTVRALGRDEGIRVRRADGATFDADMAGWDPTTGLVVLRVAGLAGTPVTRSAAAPRVGHLALALARSWSNAVTATAGVISVIGGPLPTGRRRAIDQVIRTTAPMHDGFAGGAFLDTGGALIGVTTAASIRGSSVVIPAAIAWKSAASLLEHGTTKRGFLGISAQPVQLPESQRTGASAAERALLVVGVTGGSPAHAAGVLVGDLLAGFEGHPVETPDELLDLLTADRVGRTVTLDLIRGGAAVTVPVVVGERPA
jgi:S1-C subfamily serine protease